MRKNVRIVVYWKPARGRYKVYLLWETSQDRPRRVAMWNQPYGGFSHADEAHEFAAKLSADDMSARTVGMAGTKPPANERIVPPGEV